MKFLKHLFIITLLLCSTVATAHDFEVDGIYYNITDETNKTVEVTYLGSMCEESGQSDAYIGEVIIPSFISYNEETYNVTKIGDEAFFWCDNLTGVVIPNSVTSIGKKEFYDCSYLTSVTIPSSVTNIGHHAFCFCDGLKEVHVSDLAAWCGIDFELGDYDPSFSSNPLYYAHNLYLNGKKVTNLVIPDGVTEIKDYTFYNCDGLTSLTIPNSVTSIGDDAFSGCSGLKTVYNLSELTLQPGSADNGYVAYYADKVINAPNGSIESDYVFDIVDGVNTLCGYLGNGGEITLPADYKGENYVIGARAFAKDIAITNVTIPNSVTSIGSSAFSGCTGLTSIEIPGSVTSIGYEAFYDCDGLTSIEIPNSVTTIGSSALYSCSGLTSVTIPNSVTSIGSGAFRNCSRLTSVTIPNGVTSIEDSVFYGCSGLTSIEIPGSVTSIGEDAFWGCNSLINVTIPGSVTSIGEDAFWACANLKTVINLSSLSLSEGSAGNGYVAYFADKVINAPNGSIEGDYVFRIVDGVNTLCGYIGNGGEITLPADYKGENYVIGAGTFANDIAITNVTIPNSVTSIGSSAFSGCSGLTSIEISNSVTSIGSSAFSGCSGLTSITIPNSVTSIGSSVFSGCTGLTSVTIGNSVTSIGLYAFNVCNRLKEVHISDLAAWSKIDFANDVSNPLYYAHNLYLNGEKVTNLVIPDGVTEIKNYAFRSCSSLISITIPNSVTSIGNSAFSGCSGLKEVHISDLAAWCKIDFLGTSSNPLSYAKNLYLNGELVTNLVIPGDVTEIKKFAFYNCSNLKTVINLSLLSLSKGSTNNGYVACYADKVINAPNGSIEEDFVFGIINGVNTLCAYLGNDVDVTLPANYKGENYAIGSSVFNVCTDLTNITISNGVTGIGDLAFNGCDGLTSITIPGSVTSIGDEAFSGCNNLSTIVVDSSNPHYDSREDCNAIIETATNTLVVGCYNTVIPNGIESISARAFQDCTGLTNIKIPNSVTSIGENAFQGCTGLKKVELSCSKIENWFSNNSSIEEVVIDDNTTEISNSAFTGCTNLKTITIGKNVKAVRESAFESCNALETIYAMGEKPALVGDNNFTIDQYLNVKLYVPVDFISKYQTADVWENFWEIEGIDSTTGIEDIETEPVKGIYYNLKGQRVIDTDNLTRGFYIINGKKVYVR